MRWSIEPGETYFKYTELRNLELSIADSCFHRKLFQVIGQIIHI